MGNGQRVDFTVKNLETLIKLNESVVDLTKHLGTLEEDHITLKEVVTANKYNEEAIAKIDGHLVEVEKNLVGVNAKVDQIITNTNAALEDKKSKRLLWAALITSLITALASIVLELIKG